MKNKNKSSDKGKAVLLILIIFVLIFFISLAEKIPIKLASQYIAFLIILFVVVGIMLEYYVLKLRFGLGKTKIGKRFILWVEGEQNKAKPKKRNK